MFNFLKKLSKKDPVIIKKSIKDDPLTIACTLAYEVARADGDISKSELQAIKEVLEVNNFENHEKIFSQIEKFSNEESSFYDYIKQINLTFSKEEKENLISILWDVAFSDEVLKTHEERLIRRIGDLIFIKNVRILKLKDKSRINS